MEWWLKALTTVTGTAAFFYSFSKYNEYYEKKGEIHPITAWIARHTCDEEKQRRERIEEVRIQAELSDKRLKSMYTFWNSHKPSAASDNDLKQPVTSQ